MATQMPSVTIKRSERTIVRCDKNQFKTPLFSFDNQGIYFRCKDCRSYDPETKSQRRGAFHLITWSDLERLKLGLVRPEEVIQHREPRSDPGGIHHVAEEQAVPGVEREQQLAERPGDS